MKRKVLCVLLSLSMLLSLAACSLLSHDDTSAKNAAAAQAAVNELIGYLDLSEDIVAESSAVFDDDLDFEEIISTLKSALFELQDLQDKADSIPDLDANLSAAQQEYFSALSDAYNAFYEIILFLSDFYDYIGEVWGYIPQLDDYNSIADYYYDLSAWYESAKNGYSAISSCPACMERQWKDFGDILDLNESVLLKVASAYYYDDWLRLVSSQNISTRFAGEVSMQADALVDCLLGEIDFTDRQFEQVGNLGDEIRAYAELDADARKDYTFASYDGELFLDYDVVDTIYPSLYNTYDSFVIVKTGCISGSRSLVVEAEIPGLTQTYKESIVVDSAYQEIHIKPPALTGSLDLSSAKNAQVQVTISERDGTLIEAKTFPVKVQSKYDFALMDNEYGVATLDNILCFLSPESSAISELKRRAIDEMSAMTSGRLEHFVGYQETEFDHYLTTYLQAAGLMRALNVMGVRYNADSFSLSNGHQHILLPEAVLDQQSGLCVETALVVASALQSAEMHAFLIFPPGHAQVAVEIWNDGEGAGEYFLIETTKLSDQENNRSVFASYANAFLNEGVLASTYPIAYLNESQWYNYIHKDGTYIIDCNDSSVLGLTPFAN